MSFIIQKFIFKLFLNLFFIFTYNKEQTFLFSPNLLDLSAEYTKIIAACKGLKGSKISTFVTLDSRWIIINVSTFL